MYIFYFKLALSRNWSEEVPATIGSYDTALSLVLYDKRFGCWRWQAPTKHDGCAGTAHNEEELIRLCRSRRLPIRTGTAAASPNDQGTQAQPKLLGPPPLSQLVAT